MELQEGCVVMRPVQSKSGRISPPSSIVFTPNTLNCPSLSVGIRLVTDGAQVPRDITGLATRKRSEREDNLQGTPYEAKGIMGQFGSQNESSPLIVIGRCDV